MRTWAISAVCRSAWAGSPSCFPALILNYFGQGALLLADPRAVENPFYLLAPGWAHYPMVAFATVATIIASQAIISGAFSLTQQAIQLGFLPRMRVLHTASHEKGQIYMPLVNWLLAAGTTGSGDHVRLLRRARRRLRHRRLDADGGHHGPGRSRRAAMGLNPLAVAAVNGSLLVVDFIFVAANATSCSTGGWFPLLLACVVAFLMLTWRTGCLLLERQRIGMRQREDEFVEWVLEKPPLRLPGAAAIFTAGNTGIPLALTHHIGTIASCTSVCCSSPRHQRYAAGRSGPRVKLVTVGAGITRVQPCISGSWNPNVMDGLKLACRDPGLLGIDPEQITFYSPPGDGGCEWQGTRHGGLAGAAFRGDAPQRQSSGHLFRRPDRPGR